MNYRIYLDAVAIPRAIGSRRRSLSSVACTKFAPTKPVTTTAAAVTDALAPADMAKFQRWNCLSSALEGGMVGLKS